LPSGRRFKTAGFLIGSVVILALVLSTAMAASWTNISVIYPNGGETFTQRKIWINWSANSSDNLVINIYYDRDNDSTNGYAGSVANNLSNTNNTPGAYWWDMLGVFEGSYYIHIDAITPSYTLTTDYSDSNFSRTLSVYNYTGSLFNMTLINNSGPVVKVIQPNGGETINGTYTILFNVSDADDDPIGISIYYSNPAGSHNFTITTNNLSLCTDPDMNATTENNCSFVWNTGALNGYFYIDVVANDSIHAVTNSSASTFLIDNIPIISGVSVADLSETYATIAWLTDEATNSSVNYSVGGATYENQTVNASNVTYHIVNLTNLQGNRVHYFMVQSCDNTGNCVNATGFNFTTLNSLPEFTITSPNGSTVITTRYADINWTSLDADGDANILDIYYGTGLSFWNGSMTLISGNETDDGTYNWSVLGVPAGVYYVCAYMKNYDNRNGSWSLVWNCTADSFTKGDVPTEYTGNAFAMTILNNSGSIVKIILPNSTEIVRGNYTILFNVSDADDDPATISLYFSNPAGSHNFTLTLNNLSLCTDSDMNATTENNCSYVWTTGSLNGYFYIDVVVNDSIHAVTNSSELFLVDNIPIISGVSVVDLSATYATIAWLTDEATNSSVNYSMGGATYENQTVNASNVTYHIVNLTNLQGNRVHYFMVQSCDNTGNCVNATGFNFTTLNQAPALNVTFPNGGETVNTHLVNITWNCTDADNDQVWIDVYYDDDNQSYNGRTLLAANESNDGNYTWWNLQGVYNGDYYISIDAKSYNQSSGQNTTITDYSDSYFTKDDALIEYTGNPTIMTVVNNSVPSVRIIQPDGSADVGGIYTILFNVSDPDEDPISVSIYMHTFTPGAPNLTLTENDPSLCTDSDMNTTTENNCSYVWDTGALSGYYYMDIIANDSIHAVTNSSNQFRVYNTPVISDVSVIDLSATYATVAWLTDGITNGSVNYSRGSESYVNQSVNASYVTSHIVNLTNLDGNRLHYFMVESCVPIGGCANATGFSFTTVDRPPVIEVTYPNGGETINTRYANINWTASDPDGDEILLDIYYDNNDMTDDGRTLLAEDESNDGTYNWSVMGVFDGQYLISIDAKSMNTTSGEYAVTTDYSDDTFTKIGPLIDYSGSAFNMTIVSPEIPLVSVTKPSEDEIYNDSTRIEFNVSDPAGDYLYAGIYYNTTAYYRQLNIRNGKAMNLTDYPVLITLDTQSLIAQKKTRIDAAKLKVKVAGVTVPYFIENRTLNSEFGMNTTETMIWFPLNISANQTRSDIYLWYEDYNNVSDVQPLEAGNDTEPDWSRLMVENNVVLNKPVIATSEQAPDHLASKSNDGNQGPPGWKGLNTSGEWLDYNLEGEFWVFRVDYNLTGGGIAHTLSRISRDDVTYTTVNESTYESDQTFAVHHFRPSRATHFVVDMRSVISEPTFYEVSLYTPYLLNVTWGSETKVESFDIVQSLDLADPSVCTDEDRSTITENNCSYVWDSSVLDGHLCVIVNITGGKVSGSDYVCFNIENYNVNPWLIRSISPQEWSRHLNSTNITDLGFYFADPDWDHLNFTFSSSNPDNITAVIDNETGAATLNSSYNWFGNGTTMNFTAYDPPEYGHTTTSNYTNLTVLERYWVVNLDPSLDVVLESDPDTSVRLGGIGHEGQLGIKTVYLTRNYGERIARLYVNFSSGSNPDYWAWDPDWWDMLADTNNQSAKSFIHYNQTNHTEIIGDRTLYVPSVSGSKLLYVCPGAASLADVNYSCNDNYTYVLKAFNLTESSAAKYYALPVGGTGAGEAGDNQSRIVNNASQDTSLYVLLKVQYWNGTDGVWVDDSIIWNDTTTPITIEPGENNQLKLETIWNNYSGSGHGWVTSTRHHDLGTYRAWVSATDANGAILHDIYGDEIYSTYNFTIHEYIPTTNCGDCICDVGENPCNCRNDCGYDPNCGGADMGTTCGDGGDGGGYCGDGACAGGENCTTCARDCGECPAPGCGDHFCDPLTETCSSCSLDCGDCECTTSCDCTGNTTCTAGSCVPCARDYRYTCLSDGTIILRDFSPCGGCDSHRTGSCPYGCSDTCPEGCYSDPKLTCLQPPHCPNTTCDEWLGENCTTCPGDCGVCRTSECESDSDCAYDEHCANPPGVCFRDCFVSVSPERSSAFLGMQDVFIVNVTEPTGSAKRSIRLSVTGSGEYFAKFYGTQPSTAVTLDPSESRQVPLYFVAAEAGTKEAILYGQDIDHPNINNSRCPDTLRMATLVSSTEWSAGAGFLSIMAAPGSDILGLILAAMVSSIIYSVQQVYLKKKK